jgi:hypothetical protein
MVFRGVLLMLFILASSAFSKAELVSFAGHDFVVDMTSLSHQTINETHLCRYEGAADKVLDDGTPVKVFGVAMVYLAPGKGTSVFGHVGVRLVYCYGTQAWDSLVEWTQFTAAEEYSFQSMYPRLDMKSLSSELDHAFFVKTTLNPASLEAHQGPSYALYQVSTNRNIFEAWLELSSKYKLQFLEATLDRIQEQNVSLAAPKSLPKYDKFSRSCVTQLVDLLKPSMGRAEAEDFGNPVLPQDFFIRVLNHFKFQGVFYPSQRSWRILQRKTNPSLEKGKISDSPFIVYPYGLTSEPNYQENLAAGLVNLPEKLGETLFDSSQAVVSGHWAHAKESGQQSLFALLQTLGWTFLHPASTSWSEDEIALLVKEAQQKPTYLRYLN